MANTYYRDPATGERLPERRSVVDRRGPSAFLSIFSSPYRRRKSKGRRKTDRGAYVDVYDSRSWSIAIMVLILSFFDAVLTAFQVTAGSAREVNPVMNAVLSQGGVTAFLGVKAAMTVFPMAVILVHKEWALGRFAARLCLYSYVLIFFYHMYLIFLAPSI
jgi:hypothetical protein